MRIIKSILFLLLIPLCLWSQENDILSKKILFPDNLEKTRDYIDYITQQTSYYFSYDSDLINDTATIKFSYNDSVTINNFLFYLTGTKNIAFKVTSSHVIIQKDGANNQITSISGKIISEGKPLYGATIYLKHQLKGGITNADGDFLLKFKSQNSTDTLIIGHIGYHTKQLALNKLSTNNLQIELLPHSFALDEIVITAVSPETIIRKMISNIKNVYPKQNINYHTFYREEVLINEDYKYFSEAVLEVFKNSYTHIFNSEKIKVIQSRTIRSSTMDSLLLKIKSGLRTALYLDVVRYQPDFLHSQTLERYHYSIENITYQDNDIIYIISFSPRKDAEEALYSGKLYINGRLNTLKKVQFQYAPHQKHKLRDLLSNNYERLNIIPQQASYEVRYLAMNGTCYLQYISTLIQMKLKQKKDWFSTPISVKSSFNVVGIDTLNVVKPSNKEVVNPAIIFSENDFDYQPDFWGKYNFLKPSNKIISDLKKMLQVKKEVKLME
jgi:hypothetical protein